MKSTWAVLLFSLTLTSPTSSHGASDPACPLHAQHQPSADHFAGVDQRGDEVMGFSHQKTTHRFLVEPQGGIIQVVVQESADAESLRQIRGHLAEVARDFAAGDFSMPKQIHDRVLPGVPEMIQRKEAIDYRYEDMENGGRVVIRTADPEAVAAIHAFLQAQIADHRTH